MLDIEKLQERFDSKHKMSLVQLQKLFPDKEFTKQQFRFLKMPGRGR